MPRTTTAYAKNVIRRAFREMVDPSPDKESLSALWIHFNSSCAYCERPLQPGTKSAHTDHLVSACAGGPNHISNRVLSCATCNEVEKRDLPWESFLQKKCDDDVVFQNRKGRIFKWQLLNSSNNPGTKEPLLQYAEELAADVITKFDQKVADLKASKARLVEK